MDNLLLWIITPRIGRHDDAVAAVEQLGDYTDLFQYPAVGFVAFLGTDLTGNEQELIGNDWQVVPAEALDAVAVRQCWLHQMTENDRAFDCSLDMAVGYGLDAVTAEEREADFKAVRGL